MYLLGGPSHYHVFVSAVAKAKPTDVPKRGILYCRGCSSYAFAHLDHVFRRQAHVAGRAPEKHCYLAFGASN